MALGKQVRELHLEKKKSFWIVLAVEVIVLLLLIVGLFGKNETYTYGADGLQITAGNYDPAVGFSVDSTSGANGQVAKLTNVSLPMGVYRVSMQYVTDTNMKNMCTVTNAEVGYHSLLSNGEHMYAGLNSTDFTMWLLQDTSQLEVAVEYGGEGSLSVQGITISRTNALNRIFVFMWLVICMAVTACYIYREYDNAYQIPVKNKLVTLGLVAVIVISSMPLMVDYMLSSGDIGYHLLRIEGIKDGILAGQFPVRIAPEWQQGYGYASSVFYGETVLYLAACFRLIGFTVLTSYRLFFLIINAVTVLIAYYCFRKLFSEKYIGLLCAAVYTLSVYRIFNLYGKGSFGEAFGVMFLPLLAYGFYRVFTMDVEDAAYGRSWIPLTVGFCGLLQSHLLSTELAAGFTILLCIVLIKKVFRPKTFLVLAKTVVYTCLLSAWFLVPFLDYMLTGDFAIQHASGRTIQERGLYVANLFRTFTTQGGNAFSGVGGMKDGQAIGVGIALMVPLFVWFGILFLRKEEVLTKTERKTAHIAATFACLAMAMSLIAFPWDRIQFLNKVTATLVSSIQFPYRILTIATLCLTVVCGMVAKWMMAYGGAAMLKKWGAICLLLVTVSSVYLMDDIMDSYGFVRIYNAEGMGTGYIAGAEYLPYGADATQFMPRAPLAGEGLTVDGYQKDGLTVETRCVNTGDYKTTLEMPLLYYKGYVAEDLESGDALAVYDGTNHVVGVEIPAGYEGTVKVFFSSPWYWRAAEIVSVLTFLGLVVAVRLRGRNKKG